MQGSIERTPSGAVVFSGPAAVTLHGAIVLRRALLMRADGLVVNRHWTPTAMLAAAGRLTGKTYSARTKGVYTTAAADLQAWINEQSKKVNVINEGEQP